MTSCQKKIFENYLETRELLQGRLKKWVDYFNNFKLVHEHFVDKKRENGYLFCLMLPAYAIHYGFGVFLLNFYEDMVEFCVGILTEFDEITWTSTKF